jgi:hypothetical protein
MRFLVRVTMPTEAGNKAVKDPKFLKNIEGFVRDMKAESAYFLEMDGRRNALFFVDIPTVDMVVPFSESFFQMGADVKFHPAMGLDDLKKGFSAAGLSGGSSGG